MFEIEKVLKEEKEGFDSLNQILTEANIVRMDKQTLKKKLLTQSILLACKEAGDPLYAKYVKASKLKKAIRAKINVKYSNAGKKKMKEFLKAQKTMK